MKTQSTERTQGSKKSRMVLSVAITLVFALLICALASCGESQDSLYEAAQKLFEDGKFDEAKEAFGKLEGFKDSVEKIKDCINAITEQKYVDALKLLAEEKYDEAKSALEALGDFKDSAEKKIEAEKGKIYSEAISLINDGKITEAFPLLSGIKGFKDSVEKIKEIFGQYKDELKKNANVGGHIFLGKYEQDNDPDNGAEDIEWLILAKDGNKALVISLYALDTKSFDPSYEKTPWENSSIREWLNGEFIDGAFTEDEKKTIIDSALTDVRNPVYGTMPGKDTEDKVFFLSESEAAEYFKSDEERQCEGTAYCYAQGANKAKNGSCMWWLRSPGRDTKHASYVLYTGSVFHHGYMNFRTGCAVRPAMWIEI